MTSAPLKVFYYFFYVADRDYTKVIATNRVGALAQPVSLFARPEIVALRVFDNMHINEL
jgi:hypothetical protein